MSLKEDKEICRSYIHSNLLQSTENKIYSKLSIFQIGLSYRSSKFAYTFFFKKKISLILIHNFFYLYTSLLEIIF